MGKFPVISITLKGVDALNYEGALAALCSVIGMEAMRFSFLAESSRLSEKERELYRQLIEVNTAQNGIL